MRNLQDYLRKNNSSQKIGKEEQIRIILEETDFKKIYDIMVYLDWGWFNWSEMQYYIPRIEMLKEKAKSLLEQVWDMCPEEESEYLYICSGGFRASKMTYNGLKMLSLHFEITGWEFDYDGVQSENYE